MECSKNNSITSFHDRPRSHICPVNRYLRVFVCDVTSSSPVRPDTNDGISKYSEENPLIPLGNFVDYDLFWDTVTANGLGNLFREIL